jgi:hypothetical protein
LFVCWVDCIRLEEGKVSFFPAVILRRDMHSTHLHSIM